MGEFDGGFRTVEMVVVVAAGGREAGVGEDMGEFGAGDGWGRGRIEVGRRWRWVEGRGWGRDFWWRRRVGINF